MEETPWKRDETPYLVFPCRNCHQYSYVKTSQKTKKCLRCGFTHLVRNVQSEGEIVKGMTMAVDRVKKKQNNLAVKELGRLPDFENSSGFRVRGIQEREPTLKKNNQKKTILEDLFRQMLIKISSSYNKFPYYTLELMSDEYGIPPSDLKFLVKSYQIKGILTKCNDSTFLINLNY
jgi:hypothetical protein